MSSKADSECGVCDVTLVIVVDVLSDDDEPDERNEVDSAAAGGAGEGDALADVDVAVTAEVEARGRGSGGGGPLSPHCSIFYSHKRSVETTAN